MESDKPSTVITGHPSKDLLKLIETKQVYARSLHPKDRIEVVACLRDEGWGIPRIAELFHMSDSAIRKDIQKVKAQQAHRVKSINRDRLGGETLRLSEIIIQRALFNENYSLAWRIHCEAVDKLCQLGYVDLKPLPAQKHEFTGAGGGPVKYEIVEYKMPAEMRIDVNGGSASQN